MQESPIGFKNLDYMFYGCEKLDAPNMNFQNVSQHVTSMDYMFYGAGLEGTSTFDNQKIKFPNLVTCTNAFKDSKFGFKGTYFQFYGASSSDSAGNVVTVSSLESFFSGNQWLASSAPVIIMSKSNNDIDSIVGNLSKINKSDGIPLPEAFCGGNPDDEIYSSPDIKYFCTSTPSSLSADFTFNSEEYSKNFNDNFSRILVYYKFSSESGKWVDADHTGVYIGDDDWIKYGITWKEERTIELNNLDSITISQSSVSHKSSTGIYDFKNLYSNTAIRHADIRGISCCMSEDYVGSSCYNGKIDYTSMFEDCHELEFIDGHIPPYGYTYESMFNNCSSLEIDLSRSFIEYTKKIDAYTDTIILSAQYSQKYWWWYGGWYWYGYSWHTYYYPYYYNYYYPYYNYYNYYNYYPYYYNYYYNYYPYYAGYYNGYYYYNYKYAYSWYYGWYGYPAYYNAWYGYYPHYNGWYGWSDYYHYSYDRPYWYWWSLPDGYKQRGWMLNNDDRLNGHNSLTCYNSPYGCIDTLLFKVRGNFELSFWWKTHLPYRNGLVYLLDDTIDYPYKKSDGTVDMSRYRIKSRKVVTSREYSDTWENVQYATSDKPSATYYSGEYHLVRIFTHDCIGGGPGWNNRNWTVSNFSLKLESGKVLEAADFVPNDKMSDKEKPAHYGEYVLMPGGKYSIPVNKFGIAYHNTTTLDGYEPSSIAYMFNNVKRLYSTKDDFDLAVLVKKTDETLVANGIEPSIQHFDHAFPNTVIAMNKSVDGIGQLTYDISKISEKHGVIRYCSFSNSDDNTKYGLNSNYMKWVFPNGFVRYAGQLQDGTGYHVFIPYYPVVNGNGELVEFSIHSSNKETKLNPRGFAGLFNRSACFTYHDEWLYGRTNPWAGGVTTPCPNHRCYNWMNKSSVLYGALLYSNNGKFVGKGYIGAWSEGIYMYAYHWACKGSYTVTDSRTHPVSLYSGTITVEIPDVGSVLDENGNVIDSSKTVSDSWYSSVFN